MRACDAVRVSTRILESSNRTRETEKRQIETYGISKMGGGGQGSERAWVSVRREVGGRVARITTRLQAGGISLGNR